DRLFASGDGAEDGQAVLLVGERRGTVVLVVHPPFAVRRLGLTIPVDAYLAVPLRIGTRWDERRDVPSGLPAGPVVLGDVVGLEDRMLKERGHVAHQDVRAVVRDVELCEIWHAGSGAVAGNRGHREARDGRGRRSAWRIAVAG